MKIKKSKITAIITMVLLLSRLTLAGSVKDLIKHGNSLYNKGNFNDAIKEYDQALVDQPQSIEPKFNKANCYFHMDDLARAIDLYNEVAAESKNMQLVEKAKYNLGNCYFQRGARQKDSNLQKAMEDMQTAIVCWRGALEINPENQNAAKNIEIARLTIKDIIDQINKQRQQQQAQQQKQQHLQEKLKELAERQKALADKTQQTKNDADKGQISPQQARDDYKKQAQEQSQLRNETEQTLQQLQQQDPSNPQTQQIQQVGAELAQAVDAQSNAENKLNDSDGDAAEKSQDKAAEHLENALKEMSGGNQNQGQQQKQQEQQEQPQQGRNPNEAQKQQPEEQQTDAMADTTAQEILDKEQKEKKQRQILQRGGYQKVDKDW